MTPAAVPPVAVRAPLGSTATVRDRLARQRPRPLLVKLYAHLLGDAGVAGAPVRRRAGRLAWEAVPSLAALGGALVLVSRGLAPPASGWLVAAALAALFLATAGVGVRRALRATESRAAASREQAELGALLLVTTLALVQATTGEGGEPLLQPLVYLVVACLVTWLDRPVGLGLVALAAGLEAGGWWWQGAPLEERAAVLGHLAFLALFSLLYHAVLSGRLLASRRAEQAAVAHRLSEIEQQAREYRLLAPNGVSGTGAERAERAKQATIASVVEIETAVKGTLTVAEAALRADTCAVFLLSDDDRELVLREVRSDSDAIAATPLPAGEGAIGCVVKARAPVRLHGDDVRAASYYVDGTRPGALLAVPLLDRRGGQLRGVLLADRLEPRPFTEEDERVLEALAGEVIRAVAAERLMGGMRSSRDEWEGFFQALERLNKATKLADVLDATLAEARRLVPGACLGTVTLREGGGDEPTHTVARTWTVEGWPGTAPAEGYRFDGSGGSLVAAAVRLDSSLPAKDLPPARAVVFDPATRLRGLESVKVVPLRAEPLREGDPAVLGTLVLGSSRAGVFDQERVRQLEMVALQAGQALQRARLYDATERLATTDGLTGLTNHRTFQGRLDEQINVSQRYGRPLSLILCDIDHFKSVNDTHGHPVGDLVLKGVARILAKEARATDVVARYGGEEFALVMPEADTAAALGVAERLRERVGQLVTETGRGPLQVTMSLGIATFPADAGDKAALVERADGCLYHAKRNGRDRCVTAASLGGAHRASA